jgi:hypothetical protein
VRRAARGAARRAQSRPAARPGRRLTRRNRRLSTRQGHVLGIGTIWSRRGCMSGCTPSTPSSWNYYKCTAARREWTALGCSGDLPIETAMGSGSGCRCGRARGGGRGAAGRRRGCGRKRAQGPGVTKTDARTLALPTLPLRPAATGARPRSGPSS